MFESMDIRKVENGFVVLVHDQMGEQKEYIFENDRRLLRFIKPMLGEKVAAE